MGKLITGHGAVPTPAFLPVASQGTVKTLIPGDLIEIGIAIILSNTYHLYLRPGIEIIEKLGGLHRFMSWDGPILTDSGGYQIFSLARLCQITDDGVTFRSHIDGSEHHLTPELVIEFQEKLGADIIMALDECPAPDAATARMRQAVDRTSRWAERCQRHHQSSDQLLFGIIQGGTYPELRQRSAKAITSLDFPGYAVGGLSVGEPKEVTLPLVEQTAALLPDNKPRYLMGVGAPDDLIEGVARGIDIFDCALPTRVARNGALFTRKGRINIRRAAFSKIDKPVDPSCDCYTCRTFSAAYVSHLFRSEELLGLRLATIHNLRFIRNLMNDIRSSILDGTFTAFYKDFLAGYQTTDEQTRVAQKERWLKGRNNKA